MYYAWLLVWRSHCTQDRPMVFFHIVCCMLYVLCVEDSFCKLIQTEPQERVQTWENRKTLKVELFMSSLETKSCSCWYTSPGLEIPPPCWNFPATATSTLPKFNLKMMVSKTNLPNCRGFIFRFHEKFQARNLEPVSLTHGASAFNLFLVFRRACEVLTSSGNRCYKLCSCRWFIFYCTRVVKRMVEMVDSTTQVTTQKKTWWRHAIECLVHQLAGKGVDFMSHWPFPSFQAWVWQLLLHFSVEKIVSSWSLSILEKYEV